MRHELKTWPQEFAATLRGDKTFEFRRYDRPYCVGDVLVLREWVPVAERVDGVLVLRDDLSGSDRYTGRVHEVEVTYVLTGAHGVPVDFVCMALRPVSGAQP